MDLDLTLVSYESGKPYVPARTKELLKWLCKEGLEVGIASGRPWYDMYDILGHLGMEWGRPFPSSYIPRETFIFWLRGGKALPEEEWNKAREAELMELTRIIFHHDNHWLDRIERAGVHATQSLERLWVRGKFQEAGGRREGKRDSRGLCPGNPARKSSQESLSDQRDSVHRREGKCSITRLQSEGLTTESGSGDRRYTQ